MEVILTDYDGVLVNTEWPKAVGWWAAAKFLNGTIVAQYFNALRKDDKLAEDIEKKRIALLSLKESADSLSKEVGLVRALAGKSREDTRKEVWDIFFKNYEGNHSAADLEGVRESIKENIVNQYGEVIDENFSFFQDLYDNGMRLGLVTQTESYSVVSQAQNFPWNSSIFSEMACVGDKNKKQVYERIKQDRGLKDKKSGAYIAICNELGVSPEDTITFEDSNSGIEVAKAAGLYCIGVKEKADGLDLKLADLVLTQEDLGSYVGTDVIKAFRNESPQGLIRYLKRRGF